jgi:hypothetical protein
VRQKIENLGLGCSQKRLQKKKQVSKRRKTRGVVATFFNRSRILYVKGTRSCEAPERTVALLFHLASLWRSRRVPALLLRVFLSLSLFLSEKFEFDSIGKTHAQTFFFGSRSCARESNNLVLRLRARARKKMRAEIQTRVFSTRALRAHFARPNNQLSMYSLGRSLLFFFLFFLPCFCACASNGIHRQHIDPSLSLSLSKYAHDEKTEKKKARR